MTSPNANIYNSSVKLSKDTIRPLDDKLEFESAVSSSAAQNVKGKNVAFAFVVPAWILYIAGAACITGGAWAVDNIRKILFGEPRLKGTPAQEGLLGQIMNSIKANSKFSTLPSEVQANVFKAETESSNNEKKFVVKGNSSTTRLRKKGPRPPSNNKPALANLRNQQDGLRFQNIMKSNNIRDLPQRLYRLIADWAEHYSIQRQLAEPLDMSHIAKTPKSNPLNPTQVSNLDAAMRGKVEDGFIRIRRETSKGVENEYWFKYKTLMRNGQTETKFLRADELYEKLNATNPH